MTNDEEEKLNELYEIYEQPMYRIAFAVLKNSLDAEDAVSDAFMSIIKKIRSIGEPDSPKTKSYIIKTIRNSSIDIYRRNRRLYDRTQPIDDTIMLIPDEESEIENEVSSNYNDMLDVLNDDDKKIILLRCNDGLSWKDVAGCMKMTESSVRKRFERARKKLISMKGRYV